ncbi:diapolycopene oxygenase [Rubritalea squalenifaciens DSM 18772]|uniref:Diapolycopene oxygenase n=1 Tax=Rubritalea squalenifaciens DSM 18772 TaxID=1123071 RepID=A0A1M6STL0_9BACT|nr:phytoene desaturase family protein [Rubritalea squalenifaciens]SHK47908.1 diapolycopene oxygenase [Rubritalea squalenifaciens DSM 18772]
MQPPRVSIIGAGLGGLSAAISLKAAGYQVEVFEKNERIGGKLNVLEKDGFTFDLGPSIFTLPQFFQDLFKRAGKNMDDYVQLDPVTPHWRNFFENHPTIDLYQEPELMKAELAKLQGDPEKHWQELQGFLDYAREQYQIVDDGYFREGLDTLWEFLWHYRKELFSGKIDYKPSMAESIATRISDPKMRLILEYFIKYVGSSALDAPGYMNLMPIIQFDYGLWYVRGGMYNLARGLGKLMEEMEIPVHLGADVSSIEKNGKSVKGLHLADGSYQESDIIVSNMEVIPCYKHLLGEEKSFTNKLEKFAPACSGIVLHIGTNKIHEQLAHHNFFYSENQHKHFETVFHKKQLPDDPTLYVVAPTRTDPSKAPDGCDNIKILPHIPPIEEGSGITHEDYVALKERCIDKMERCGITGLRESIITEDLLTPVDIQRMYRSNQGSIYGVVTDWKKNYGFKAPKTSSRYNNLYFTGGSTNPGGGMPMVILSGQKCADRIIKRHPLS